MKSIALVLIALIGLLTFLRNNIALFPDQVMWILSPNIFYKAFLPLLMLASAVTAFIKRGKANIRYLSFSAMFIDAVNRFATIVNYYYEYFTYEQPEKMLLIPGTTIVKTSLVPSLIVLLVEALMITYIFRYAININWLSSKEDS